ncbi:SH3 domain-containing protein [Roseovarius sp. M141]|uniref:SH3 domain-containing protein n=1 Tax=Roseovarius sp. M141 TaxID=2583806 RepID=UPI0020CC9654|nr:SH3 domain-containing protein [Roseovarius sp. M141]
MWRFILISFGFLGFAFYEASGGADYAPSPNSLQVAMRDTPLFAAPLKVAPQENDSSPQVAVASTAALPPIQKPKTQRIIAPVRAKVAGGNTTHAQATFAGLSGIGDDPLGGLEITFASATRSVGGDDAMVQRSVQTVGAFTAETLVQDVNRLPIEQALIAPQQPADIRSVAGSNANMRSGPGTDYSAVDQLTQGTQVEILDRRGAWVELRNMQTGRTGWMADWLITAMN